MRTLPNTFAARLNQAIQTAATKAAPSLDLWITRPRTPIINKEFLEKQKILTGTNITDVAVAACHPIIYKPVTKIYAGYVDNGVAHVKYAIADEVMENHSWVDTGFSETASAIALEFDGTMPKDRKGRVEFVTEESPWVFWIDGGAVYGKVLGDTTPVTLAAANATDVFAVRGQHSEVGGFDFGLVVFYILSGQLYYRQLIGGEWYDAETVSTVGTLDLTALTLTSIAAMRTWDYRLVVQIQDSTGDMYELFTQFMGIGKQTVEHIEIKNISATGTLTAIDRHSTILDEHVDISDISAVGLRQWGLAVYGESAENVANEDGDWGKLIVITLDHPCNLVSVTGNDSQFSITDQNNMPFYSSSISVSEDGMQLTIGFIDFNSATGELLLAYTPGTITSPPINPDAPMQAWSLSFTPTNLVPPAVDPPEPLEVWNE